MFKKYLPEFNDFSGEYIDMKKMLTNACDNMKKDLN